MQVSFYAKPGHIVHWPGLKAIGQACAYVGRDLVPGSAEQKRAASHPALKEPVKVDADSTEGRRFIRLCSRDGALWPADKETAARCRVPFVEVQFDGSEWRPKAPAHAPELRSRKAAE